jgi:hypothetical protein
LSIPDPQVALGVNLLRALQQSQVIEGTDIGHVFTGLEAMMCPQPQVELNVPGPNWTTDIPNEDFATWAGDLGSAAAQKVHDEQDEGQPTQPWSRYFATANSLASSEDLEGDIDAFALRAGITGMSCGSSTGQRIPSLSGPMSQVLNDYFTAGQTALGRTRATRYSCFVQALGGRVAGRRIAGDRVRLRDRIAWRAYEFAADYYRLRFHHGYFASAGIGGWLMNRSFEVADLFMAWLEDGLRQE